MGQRQQDEIEVVVDLEDLIVWQQQLESEPDLVLPTPVQPPPPPPEAVRGEFEGWETGEEDLT